MCRVWSLIRLRRRQVAIRVCAPLPMFFRKTLIQPGYSSCASEKCDSSSGRPNFDVRSSRWNIRRQGFHLFCQHGEEAKIRRADRQRLLHQRRRRLAARGNEPCHHGRIAGEHSPASAQAEEDGGSCEIPKNRIARRATTPRNHGRGSGRSPNVGLSRTVKVCLVSRASPVQTALRNSTGDEGGPFGIPSHRQPFAWWWASGKAGTMIPAGREMSYPPQ